MTAQHCVVPRGKGPSFFNSNLIVVYRYNSVNYLLHLSAYLKD